MTNDKLDFAIDIRNQMEKIGIFQDIMNKFAVPEDRIIELFSRKDVNELAHEVSSLIIKRLSEQREKLKDQFETL